MDEQKIKKIIEGELLIFRENILVEYDNILDYVIERAIKLSNLKEEKWNK